MIDATRGLAALLSLVAGFLHAWATPEHLAIWWTYGAFFITVTYFQTAYAIVLWVVPHSILYRLGIGANAAVVVLYITSRTLGIPPPGPSTGVVEEVGAVDAAATSAELVLIVLLAALLRRTRGGDNRRTTGHAARPRPNAR